MLVVQAASLGAHSVLAPASPQAAAIARLADVFFVLGALVWLAVLGALAWAMFRRRGREREPDVALHRRQTRGVGAALAASTLILLALGAADYGTGRHIASIPSNSADTVHITVTGHQWWWEVTYEHVLPANRFTTANEIHIPVGRPIALTLKSGDVIHSFWAPNLHGKTDLIPAYASVLSFRADTPGVFLAPCAEYCGDQHAKMALLVVVQSPGDFAHWSANESSRAVEPRTPAAARGREVFVTSGCAFCHTIRGTGTAGSVAPELTHLAARQMIGAGTLPNQREQLGTWIMNPQGPKPGNHMPANVIAARDLGALLDYLTTLR